MAPNNMTPVRERRPPSRYTESSSEEETEAKDVFSRKSSTRATVSTKSTVKAPGCSIDDPIHHEQDQATTTAAVKEEDEVSSVVTRDASSEGDAVVLPRVSLSQSEDDHIHQLQTSGALNHIAGSQSILTQELDATGITHDEEEDNDTISSSSNANKNKDYASALLTQESPPQTQEEEPEEAQTASEEASENPSVEPSVVVEEDDGEEKSSESQEHATLQLSQLSCLMEAAEVLQNREQKQLDEQLLDDEENLPEEPLFDFDKEEQSGVVSMPQRPLALQEQPKSQPTVTTKPTTSKTSRSIRPPPLPLSFNGNNKRKGAPVQTPPPPLAALPASTVSSSKKGPPQKRRKMQKKAVHARSASLARRAADLAEQVSTNADVAKQLLLSMALVRTNPRTPPTSWPTYGSVIPEGFFWATYPPLENILRAHMQRYYDLSTTRCQSRDQQAFNNSLVVVMRMKAASYGWSFHKNFDDKKLRDRIRCFFKTHIQNAKKRLKTMLRNPTKRANAKALVQHLDLIQRYIPQDQGKKEEDDKRIAAIALSGIAATVKSKRQKRV